MEASVEKWFGEAVLQEAADRFRLQGEAVKLGDFENYIYEMNREDGEPAILRLTHSTHRSEAEIDAELAFIDHLAAHGCSDDAAISLPLPEGGRVATIRAGDGSSFFASLFRKAPGERAKPDSPAWGPELFREWGAVSARFHQAAASLRPLERKSSMEDDAIVNAEAYLAGEEPGILGQLQSVLGRLQELSRSSDSYGLLHGDIHMGNFHVHDGAITVFDFDDAEYNWYVHDVAIPLYYVLSSSIPESYGQDRHAYATDFFRSFAQGYLSVREMEGEWLDRIGLFLELRDLSLYIVLLKKISPEERTERISLWMEQIKSRILAGEPIISLDFHELAASGR